MSTPEQERMLHSGERLGDLEQDVDANLICPSPVSCLLSTICFPAWVTSIKQVEQNEHAAVLVWGSYVGSITKPGLTIINPCGVNMRKCNISRLSYDMRDVQVTDKVGNPIIVSGNVAYKIYSAKKACVDTMNPAAYVADQAPMTLRRVAARFTYDELRGEGPTQLLQQELQLGVRDVGVQVLTFQITDLKYSRDIAEAMLAKQIADVQVEAKRRLVKGAAETASATVKALRELGHAFSAENEQRMIHDLLLKNLDPDYKASTINTAAYGK